MKNEVKKAAVLIPFMIKDNKLHLVFTLRNQNLSYHGGQICFPGGRQEEGELPIQTALREAEEEIGLNRELVEIVAELQEEMAYTSNYLIKPFVALIKEDVNFKVNEREVKEIIVLPLEVFLSLPLKVETSITRGREISYPVYEWKGYKIWGATARIVSKLLERKDVLDELNRRTHVHIGRNMESNRERGSA
ncbi:MAG: CoA pyrophosphatase [Synergistetes bacterium]|nr:CoA pyrophosphatase [Synergistota bacterium]MDW8192368.1 CoA pyrophosphatase [Synergistota bacterium]